MWKACHNGLHVKDNLSKRRISNSMECPICGGEVETIKHAPLLCSWTRPFWFGMQLQCTPTPTRVALLIG